MSKVKLRDGWGPRFVPLLDREVTDGETVEVPDFQPAHNPESKPGDPDHLPIVWPEETWEPVGDAKPAKTGKPGSDPAAGKAAT
jgi:hypothetical protein